MNTRRVMTWVIFWSSVALALGALAWVSVEVVSLEKREAHSRAQATREESIRRALWRLDSMMAPILAVEASRPIEDYSRLQAWSTGSNTLNQPRVGTALDSYAIQYFNLDEQASEQEDASVSTLLRNDLVDDSSAQAQAGRSSVPPEVASKASESDFDARNRVAQIATQNAPQRGMATPDEQIKIIKEEPERLNNPTELMFAEDASPSVHAETITNGALMDTAPPPSAGSLTPRWIERDNELRLVLVRDAIVNNQPVLQGLELDWNKLRVDLLRSISDVLPGATLAPSNTTSLGAYRMATIPVVLVPPPEEFRVSWAWSPARVGLVVTWIAIIATIIAVGVVLRAAIVLSERRGRFVSAVTHELRTPLTTFRLYAQMLADGMVSDDQVRADYLSTLKRESERLTGIVENVLEYARLSRVRSTKGKSSGEQTLSPGALVARFRPALARRLSQDNMDLVASLDLDAHQDRTVTVDPHAVERVMMNLIENACKYASPADEDSDEHDTRVHLDVGIRDGMLEMLVADHGPGIAPAERAKVFGEFQRGLRGLGNARSGLGLGLALSRGLAREMGGDLTLTHRRGHGAEFLFTIPLDERNKQ